MKVRKLKVYQGTGQKAHPKILLEGKWLSDLGFTIGTQIQVECDENRLVIQIEKTTAEEKSIPFQSAL